MNNERIKELAMHIANIRDDDDIKLESLLEVVKILEERIIGQEVILKLLEIKGTQKLLNSLTHNNSSKRKLAGKLLCELVFQNEANQEKICELCDFNPVNGSVMLNLTIPAKFYNRIQQILEQLRDPRKLQGLADRNQKFWSYPKFEASQINQQQQQQQLQQQKVQYQYGDKSRSNNKYNIGTGGMQGDEYEDELNQIIKYDTQRFDTQFPDPAEYLFGFFVVPAQVLGANGSNYNQGSLNQSVSSNNRNQSFGRNSSSTRRASNNINKQVNAGSTISKDKHNTIIVNPRSQGSDAKNSSKTRTDSRQNQYSGQKIINQNQGVKGSFNQSQKVHVIQGMKEPSSLNASPVKINFRDSAKDGRQNVTEASQKSIQQKSLIAFESMEASQIKKQKISLNLNLDLCKFSTANGSIQNNQQSFLKSAGSGSESATQIMNQLNTLAKKKMSNNYGAHDNDYMVQDSGGNNQNVLHVPRRNGFGPTILETEETGFSAVEEEVKSNQMVNRPTVYAGMQAKGDKTTSQNDGSDAYSDLINKYVDHSIDSTNVNMIDQFYHSQSNTSSKRNSNVPPVQNNRKPHSKPQQIIHHNNVNNLHLSNDSAGKLFIREDIQLYPLTAKEKIKVVQQQNMNSGRSSQRNQSNGSSQGSNASKHQKNKFSHDLQNLNLVSHNYNRNVPSQSALSQSQMTPENMTRHVKSVYGNNSQQDSLSKQKTSANKIQSIVQRNQYQQNNYKTGTLDLSSNLNTNTNHLQNTINFKPAQNRIHQQLSTKKNNPQSLQNSINHTQVLNNNSSNGNGVAVNNMSYYNQNNMSIGLNNTQNSSLLMALGHQQQMQNSRKHKDSVTSGSGNNINSSSYMMQNNNHLHHKQNHNVSGSSFNATTVVNIKDIDKRLLNLMKTMGN
ncbi:UNKNOWN [Stylonychia lemnae]|uniref:Uncharacterized protein n=1 Tax=Stylonychia lemnae TaxID=5949 RepID=A0A077ZTU3_STYLE|nr:UNKNOWN [Stylonychia lemnae]|eukprot:CDW72745.1 UNKNOWN [Stylonychia lemnae]